MPVAPPTIGLSFGSFGDIVAVLQLAWDLRAALDESAGASAELKSLVDDVDSFTRALQDVQANIERRRMTLRPDVVNGIAAALSRCRNVLHAIHQRIERARSQTSSSGWQKYWGTTAWSILGGKKDVKALRTRLSEQLGIMQLYLSLSEANSQEHVQGVLAANSTTLQRIYSVVQDIQLRFDVGVPGFHFYNPVTERYDPPIARTSLQRLRDVCNALRYLDDKHRIPFWIKQNRVTDEDFKHLSVISAQATIPVNFRHCAAPVFGSVASYFFREAAFGEWQVLVGSMHSYWFLDGALKTLLERSHTRGAHCNCPVACTARYWEDVNDMVWRFEASKVYSEVVSLIFGHLQPARSESGWISALIDAFMHWPDPDHLRLTIPTILSRQRLSPSDIIDLISKTPSSHKPAYPLKYKHNSHVVRFIVGGGPRSEYPMGDLLPCCERAVPHTVRLPDWGYIPFGETDESGRSVLTLAMNLNNECPCFECLLDASLKIKQKIGPAPIIADSGSTGVQTRTLVAPKILY